MGEFGVVVEEELNRVVRRDLLEVVNAEFERIAGIYRDMNALCLDVDVVRVHPHVEVHDLRRIDYELPSVKSVYFIFSGGKTVKVGVWRYDIDIVGDNHVHEVGTIEVIIFGDRCFIMKDIDGYELDYAVKEIVADLLKGLREGEV